MAKWVAAAIALVSLFGMAEASPACDPADNRALCELAEATRIDNPALSELSVQTEAIGRARDARHAARRVEARTVLNALAEPTWRDLYRAGYNNAYGKTPEEDLLAHAIAIRALSLAPNEADTHFLVAMTLDELARRYLGAQVYGRQRSYTLDPTTGAVTQMCLPDMIEPPLPASIGRDFHAPDINLSPCPADETSARLRAAP
jgi:hypothetical protein